MANQSADPANALGEHVEAIRKALRKPLKIIFCENPTCNKPFKQVRHWQKFCSVQCRTNKFWSEHERMTVPINNQQQNKDK